jgi:hypothetical protein
MLLEASLYLLHSLQVCYGFVELAAATLDSNDFVAI